MSIVWMPAVRRGRRTFAFFVGAFALFSGSQAWANPDLPVGVWTEITPSQVTTGAAETCIGQGIAIDRQNPNIIYWGNTPFESQHGGFFKTTDAGETWTRTATVTPLFNGASDHLDMPLHVRIDPNDSNHLYVGDGVRGGSPGFYISTDAGANFVLPQGFKDVLVAEGIDNQDIYDVAVDPVNFAHVLLSYHYRWGWTETKWNASSGVLESTDGGESWVAHPPEDGWGSGHSIDFLYDPEKEIGDSNTWLLGTQGAGYWRTTDAGASWTKVSNVNITHGGGDRYYAVDGTLYTSGEQTIRSTDNGVTWESVGPGSSWAVHGDGTTLFSGGGWGSNQPFKVSAETDGATWTNYSEQTIGDGPYEMTYDDTNGIMYSSSWFSGVWALKIGEGTGVIPDPPGPPPEGGSGNSSGGSSAAGSNGTGVGGGSGLGGSGVSSGGTTSAAGGSSATSSGGSGGASGPLGASSDRSTTDANAGCACRVGAPPSGANRGYWALVLLGLSVGLRTRLRRDSQS